MMLTKKDLSKEFSLVVQQEIKNHNDSILATNISISEIKRDLSLATSSLNSNLSRISSLVDSQYISLASTKDSIDRSIEKCNREINDIYLRTEEAFKSLRTSLENRESYFLTLEDFKAFVSKVDQWIATIQRSFSGHKDFLSEKISDCNIVNKNNLEVLKKEIEQKILEHSDEIKDQNKFLNTFSINFDGIKREIELLKKRSFVIDKNIENLYTQIDRVKQC